jgi:hypothetical protein
MPKYIGPYEVIQLGEGGPVYHQGDNVTGVSADQLAKLRDIEGYRFEDDPPTAVSPFHAQTESNTVVMPPNEFGISEVPAEDADKGKSKKD